jgi:uncharacterized membrane protein YtjA (UPF0391 family)
MLRIALACLVIALLAGLFGFNIVQGFGFFAAQIAFFAFLVVAIVAFLIGSFRTPPPF